MGRAGTKGRSKNGSATANNEEDEQTSRKSIASKALQAAGLVSSPEEARSILDSLWDDDELIMQQELQDFFGLSPEDASEIVAKTIVSVDSATEAPDESDESGNNDEAEDDELDQDDDDDGELIGEGECELCERFIKLTKHHLIPKSTYHRLEARLMNASTALAKGDEKKAIMILGPGLHHLIPCLTITSNRAMIRKTMTASTCLICRPCHSMIHRTHDNLTLALEYSTVEQLLSDKAIYNFCKWAHNQKSGKYSALAKSR